MKKVAAILLSTLFLFNLIGYRFVFNYLQQQSDIRLEASLDKDDYNEAELLTIKVPLSLPYLNNQTNFERVSGEITVKGKIYKYVKRKISEGNLILLCLPDYNKMRIESEKSDYFKYANDVAQNNNSKKSDNSKAGFFKNMLSEFDTNVLALSTRFSLSESYCYNQDYLYYLPSSFTNLVEQPPELI